MRHGCAVEPVEPHNLSFASLHNHQHDVSITRATMTSGLEAAAE